MNIKDKTKNNTTKTVKLELNEYIKELSKQNILKLPTELELSKKFSTSRGTLRTILTELENRGTIIRIHGKGTFINQNALYIKTNLIPGTEFTRLIEENGYVSKMEVIDFHIEKASKQIADKLQIELGSNVIYVEKIFYANNCPALVCIDIFSQQLIPDCTSIDDIKSSTFYFIKEKTPRIIVQDKIEIHSVSKKEMEIYTKSAGKMECESMVMFKGINYDQNNIPIIYDIEFYNTNYICFELVRNKVPKDYVL